MSPEPLLADFVRALAALEDALATPAEDDVRRAGCIQYFEFCFELAWKTIKAVGVRYGLADLHSPRGCLRQAWRQGWIEAETPWQKMLEARNLMAHTYDARRALTVYESLPGFLAELRRLHQVLSALPAK
jgi:nucleotidyltransferase substrate binding protein (TIGR01987 family)